MMRERKVLAALTKAGRATPFDLVADAYDDTPKMLYPLAARSLEAHLIKLVEDSLAERDGEEFVAKN